MLSKTYIIAKTSHHKMHTNTEALLSQITLEDFLTDPNGENLVALGEDRNQIILNSLAGSFPTGEDEAVDLERRTAMAADTVAMFVKVTRNYHDYLQITHIRGIIEQTIGKCLCS